MNRSIFFNIMLTIVLCSSKFQKIIWIYWDSSHIQQAPVIVQECLKKFKYFAEKDQWQLNLVNDQNLHKFLTNYESQYLPTLKKSIKPQTQSQVKADLLRLFLLAQHGGVWFDISSILYNQFGLQWLSNVDHYKDLAVNKYTQQPDVLMFTWSNYQSTQLQFDQHSNAYNEYPGYQSWFIAASKNSTLIKQWKQTYSYFTTLDYFTYKSIIAEQDIFVKTIDCAKQWYGINIALAYVLALRQNQLDSKTSLFHRQTVYEYYALWHIPGEFGPMFSSASFYERNDKLFVRTKKELIDEFNGHFNMFLKLNGPCRRYIEGKLTLLEEFSKRNLTIKQFIQKNPSQRQCRDLKFIVQDSLIQHEIITVSNTFKQKYQNAIITIQERELFEKYCIRLLFPSALQKYDFSQNLTTLISKDKVSLHDLILRQNQWFYQIWLGQPLKESGELARVDLIQLKKNKDIQSWQYLLKFIQIHKFLKNQVIFVIIYILIYLLIIFIIEMTLIKYLSIQTDKLIQNRWCKFQKEYIKNVDPQMQLQNQTNYSFKKNEQVRNMNTNNHYFSQKNVGIFEITFYLSAMLKLLILIAGQLIVRMSINKGMNLLTYSTLLFIFVVKMSNILLQKALKPRSKFQQKIVRYITSMEQFYYFFCIFIFIWNRQSYAIKNTVLFCLVWSQLLKILKDLKEIMSNSDFYTNMVKIKYFFEFLFIAFVVLSVMVPNLKDIQIFSIYSKYIISKLVNVILITVFIMVGYILVSNINSQSYPSIKNQIKWLIARLFYVGLLYFSDMVPLILEKNIFPCDQHAQTFSTVLIISIVIKQIDLQKNCKQN